MTHAFLFGVALYCAGIANNWVKPITDPWLFGFIGGAGITILVREENS